MRVCKHCGKRLVQYGHKKQQNELINRYYKCYFCKKKYVVCTESKVLYMKEIKKTKK